MSKTTKCAHRFFQVHIFQRKCNSLIDASCNSAVAIKSGDDVIIIDAGGPKVISRKGLKINMYLNGELTPGTKIIKHKGGSKFDVRFHAVTIFYFLLLLLFLFFIFFI